MTTSTTWRPAPAWNDLLLLRSTPARMAVVLLVVATTLVAPAFTPRATAAPTSSGTIELADLPVVDRVRDELGELPGGHAMGTHSVEEPDRHTEHAAGDMVEWTELAPQEAADIVMVGLEVEGEDQPAAAVRTRTDGEWIDWTPLVYAGTAEGPDAGTGERRRSTNTTEPLWIGEVDRLQVRVEGHEVDRDRLRLHTVEVHGSTAYDPTAPQAGAAEASAGVPDIVPRTAWDPNNECRPRRPASTADSAEFAVIHHTASSNGYAKWQADDQLRGICLYHRNARGWNDIGYNFLVDRYGRAYEGRAGGMSDAVIGAHAAGYNTGSIGVSILGDFQTSSVPSGAIRAVERVVTWKFALHGIDPKGTAPNGRPTIMGHRDVGQTSCPGADVVPHVRRMGDRIDAEVTELRAQIRNWDEGQVGDFRDGQGEGIVTYNAGTGNTMVADPNDHSFHYEAWSTFQTREGWTERLVGDFSGDGRDDVVYFHPASGRWWVNRANGGSFHPEHWSTFKSTAGWQAHLVGDFTGDDRQDIASYHRNGTWWVSESTGDGFEVQQWGAYRTSDGWQAHRAGDFTGDGRDDVLSYHPGAGTWYVLETQATGLLERRGTHFDYERVAEFRTRTGWTQQLAGDFDGDGRADVAAYHPSNGTWWVGTSEWDGLDFTLWSQFRTHVGWQDHLAGDVTGDGRDDLVSYHPRSGNFWVSTSAGDRFAGDRWMQFGLRTGWGAHRLVDVDADGRKDVASYHRQYDDWWVMRSTGTTPFETPHRNAW